MLTRYLNQVVERQSRFGLRRAPGPDKFEDLFLGGWRAGLHLRCRVPVTERDMQRCLRRDLKPLGFYKRRELLKLINEAREIRSH